MPSHLPAVLHLLLVIPWCGQSFMPIAPASLSSSRPPNWRLYHSAQAAVPVASNNRVEQLREEILSLVAIPEGQNVEVQRMALAKRMDFLLSELAKGYVPAQTVHFANMVLQGSWVHQFTSWRGRSVSDAQATAVALEEVVQVVSPNLTSGQILNKIYWREATSGEPLLTGRFDVSSTYQMNSKGVLELTLEEQALYPDRAPKDPHSLLKGLQRVCPIDLWGDPDAPIFMEITYLDHELRVVQVHSTRFGTVTNLFVRKNSGAEETIRRRRQDHAMRQDYVA